ncbi:radical SAM family heme chaperone HemW [Alicyclobacillus sp. SO9]|uniref:radical SAM family heme chaperone HemW n=1 Tax=Alicyclobacillus sp. SO9 TaxID=2665646 RepID=UPI0018E8FBBC|nr:radical SAM family heme chaperone HemW [Alicyclobacillus sp. SO9]QQE77349.1 oxygen-independent coproporphyrinogen III oxidase [Alicyclobacillus sp. SO9]
MEQGIVVILSSSVRSTLLQQTAAPTALYVHIPFCGSRCHYCDFATFVAPHPVRETYLDALLQELKWLSEMHTTPLKSVFIGGGTPTLLSVEQLERLLKGIQDSFQLKEDAEFTIEANPGTVTEEKLRMLRQYGVNRISFGAQTFNDTLLLAIGRLHDADTVDKSIRMAQSAGFKRISIDLMFGLPDQTLLDVRASIQRFLDYNLEHVSAYWLKVEKGTPFHDWQEQGMLPLPGEDAEADMYEEVRRLLTDAGYEHYEISNFALPGAASVHNLVYWHNEPYLAAGVGAHGYVMQTRYENTRHLSQYIDAVRNGKRPVADSHEVTAEEYAENTMMLGLRLREGVSDSRFRALHGTGMLELFRSVIERLEGQGLLEWADDTLRLTPMAWPIANLVFEEFVGALLDN